MARKKLKKFKMAVGICGPTVLYTNIIKAYSEEEAARKFLEENLEDGTDKEITEEDVQDTAKRMFEVTAREPVKEHVDARGEALEPGDAVYAIVKADGNNFTIVDGTVTKLTGHCVKVQADREYTISAGYHQTFSRVVKVPVEMKVLKEPEVGCQAAYMDGMFYSHSREFAFGTVEKIAGNYIYIKNDEKEARRTPDRIRCFR